MAHKKLINDDTLKGLFSQKKSLKEIGSLLGVSGVAIWRRARRLNLQRPKSVMFKPVRRKREHYEPEPELTLEQVIAQALQEDVVQIPADIFFDRGIKVQELLKRFGRYPNKLFVFNVPYECLPVFLSFKHQLPLHHALSVKLDMSHFKYDSTLRTLAEYSNHKTELHIICGSGYAFLKDMSAVIRDGHFTLIELLPDPVNPMTLSDLCTLIHGLRNLASLKVSQDLLGAEQVLALSKLWDNCDRQAQELAAKPKVKRETVNERLARLEREIVRMKNETAGA